MVFLIIPDALFCSECGTKLEDIGVLESTEIQDNDDNNAERYIGDYNQRWKSW